MSDEATQVVAAWISELEHWRRRLDAAHLPVPPRLPAIVRNTLLDYADAAGVVRPRHTSGLAGQPDSAIDQLDAHNSAATMAAMQMLKALATELGGRNGVLILDAMRMLGVPVSEVEVKTVQGAVLPHTCYLVAFLTSRGRPSMGVDGYGIFSEPSPTVSHRYLPSVVYETHGRSYDEAQKEMKTNIEYFATRNLSWASIKCWLDLNPRGRNWADPD